MFKLAHTPETQLTHNHAIHHAGDFGILYLVLNKENRDSKDVQRILEQRKLRLTRSYVLLNEPLTMRVEGERLGCANPELGRDQLRMGGERTTTALPRFLQD